MSKHFYVTLLLLSQLVLTSCGDLFTKKKADASFAVTATCEIDAKALSNYFVKEIRSEIRCLESYLNDFIKVVKTDKPGFLSLDELLVFIDKNLEDFDEDLIGPIEGIFKMNSLLYGDDPKYIYKKNMTKLVDVFIDVNHVLIKNKVYDSFVDKSPKLYYNHIENKGNILDAFVNISRRLSREFKTNGNSLVFTEFLDHFRHLDDSNIIENSEKLLFIKKIILGGLRNTFTALELRGLIDRLSDIAVISFDLAQFANIIKDEQEEENIIQTLSESATKVLRSLYYQANSNEHLFTSEEALDAISIFYTDINRFKNYIPELLELKDIFFGNNSTVFTGKDIYFLFSELVVKNLDRGVFFYRAYNLNKDQLNSNQSILFDFNIVTVGEKEIQYRDTFNRIVQNYQYFKGTNASTQFVPNSKRSAYSLFEISVIEDLVSRFFRSEGELKDDKNKTGKSIFVNEHVMTLESLEASLRRVERLLVDEGFVYRGRLANTVETVTLMATLFQHQSNGNEYVEVNELTEFGLGILSSSNIAIKVADHLTKLCQDSSVCELDHKQRIDADFYKDNIDEIFKVKIADEELKDYFPGLVEYLNDEKVDPKEYFQITENFSRSCTFFNDGTPVSLESADFFSMFAGMMAVEQTMLRFDVAGPYGKGEPDGILQPSEVMAAFPIYDAAIKEIIPVGFLKRFSKSFYQYLIKYEKVPDVTGIRSLKDFWRALKQGAHFVGFIFKSQKKKRASADRYTIAKILEVLADFSPANTSNPFPCEELR